MFKAISLKVTLWCGTCFAQAMLWEQLSTLRYAVSSSVRVPLGVPQQAVSMCHPLSHLLPLKQHSSMKDVLFSVLKALHRALHFTVPWYAFLKGEWVEGRRRELPLGLSVCGVQVHTLSVVLPSHQWFSLCPSPVCFSQRFLDVVTALSDWADKWELKFFLGICSLPLKSLLSPPFPTLD